MPSALFDQSRTFTAISFANACSRYLVETVTVAVPLPTAVIVPFDTVATPGAVLVQV